MKAREQRVAGCEAGGGADVSRAELQANRHGSFWRHLQPAAGRAQQRHSYNLKWQPCRTPSCQHHHLTQHTLSEKANFTSSQCVCVTMCLLFFHCCVYYGAAHSSQSLQVENPMTEMETQHVDNLQPRKQNKQKHASSCDWRG